MAIEHCALCDRKVDARRQIGAGTLILVLITAGLWLLAIPFYSARCPICKSSEFGTSSAGVFTQAVDDGYRGERGRKVGAWLGRQVRKLWA